MIDQELGVKMVVSPPAVTNVKMVVNLAPPSGDSAKVYNQKPLGAIDGMNAIYTALSPFQPDTLVVIIDGLSMEPIEDYIILNNTTIQLTMSLTLGEKILFHYTKA